ncbi:MAG: hypothetical protein MUC43_16455 [Pirellula sp.]|jgi:hypothetical protein|nr:hypothetical protein [Pirellula sp.]
MIGHFIGRVERDRSAESISVLDRYAVLIAIGLNVVMVLVLARQAILSSPLIDETAHFASGVVLAKHGDPGFFRVNPPVSRWMTAIAIPFMPSIQLPAIVDSSLHGNKIRKEYDLGSQMIAKNQHTYRTSLLIARLFRIPVILLGSYFLWLFCAELGFQTSLLVQAFWCTSPLILGHGWVVSADAPAGVSMTIILWTTKQLILRISFWTVTISGIAWGIAIGTKFTFAPLYIAFPLIIIVLLKCSGRPFRFPLISSCFLGHALIACLVLNALYFLKEPFIPFGHHEFRSSLFRDFRFDRAPMASSFHSLMSAVPSPFPRLFLEGVDQQFTDMEIPKGAYLLGNRYEGSLPWFFLVGFWAKEQPAILISVIVGILFAIGFWVRNAWAGNRDDMSLNTHLMTRPCRDAILLCSLFLVAVAVLFACQDTLVWNIRYLIPGLPLVYLTLASCITSCRIKEASVGGQKFSLYNALLGAIVVLIVVDLPSKWNNSFSYINPLFGGSYRNPMVLNDSNFDYGQDLYYAESWLKKREFAVEDRAMAFRLVIGQYREYLDPYCRVAGRRELEQALENIRRRNQVSRQHSIRVPLIVSRGLYHPEQSGMTFSDLHLMQGGYFDKKLLTQLLQNTPDEWITPTIVVYDCGRSTE